jgi:hypothetical protein
MGTTQSTPQISLEFPKRHYEACQRAVKCIAEIRYAFSPLGIHPNPTDKLTEDNPLYMNLESAHEAVLASCKSMAKVISVTGHNPDYAPDYLLFLTQQYPVGSAIAKRSLLMAPISYEGNQKAMQSFVNQTNRVRNPLNLSIFEPNLNWP